MWNVTVSGSNPLQGYDFFFLSYVRICSSQALSEARDQHDALAPCLRRRFFFPSHGMVSSSPNANLVAVCSTHLYCEDNDTTTTLAYGPQGNRHQFSSTTRCQTSLPLHIPVPTISGPWRLPTFIPTLIGRH